MPAEIPFIRPSFPKPAELAEELDEIVRANWYTNFGPKERQFALAVGDYLGADLHVATFANATLALISALLATVGPGRRERYGQDLWMGLFQATSVSVDPAPGSVGVMSTGRSSSLPLWKTAPARTRATRCGAFTARQRVCAASMSL